MALTKVDAQLVSGAITTDSSGNVGIGTASPAAKFQVVGAAGAASVRYTGRSSDNSTTIDYYSNDNATRYGFQYVDSTAFQYYTTASIPLVFGTAGTERMRINSSGNLLVNTTAVVGNGYACVKQTTSGSNALSLWNSGTSGNNGFIGFGTEGTYTERGYLFYNRTAGQTQLSATSDKRLKENIVDAGSTIAVIEALKVRQFDWKDTGNTNIGFIAQEVYEVVPESVCVGEDNEDGTVNRHWGVSKEYLVPYLVKAIQELKAELDATKAEVAALKAGA